jgi:HEAT repeat protein
MGSLADKLGEVKDWDDISYVLDSATVDDADDIPAMLPRLRDLANHKAWVVRASVMDFIGAFKLVELLKVVRKKLADANPFVRSYALGAFYDLRGSKGLRTLNRLLKDKAVTVRLDALCLLFVDTGDKEYLDQIQRVVTRKNCDYHHQYAILHQLGHYLKLENHPEVLSLMRAVRATVDPEKGIAQDLDELLKGRDKVVQ